MNRRSFCKGTTLGAVGLMLDPLTGSPRVKTRHLILIVNGNGARKKEYYEDSSTSPNITRLAKNSFVFEEDHCNTVASHNRSFFELIRGFPGIVRDAYGDEVTRYWNITGADYRLDQVPGIMQRFKPRILIFREVDHDVGHDSYREYLKVVKATDQGVGKIFDWVRNHPYFSRNTAIVIRPDFGRDDEVHTNGDLHHSEGFYYAHRVASIYWGPDFNKGVDRKTIVNRLDMAPTLTNLFQVDVKYSQGRIVPGLFKEN